MRKDRNTFFTNYNAQSQSYIPNMQPPMEQFGPFQSANTSSSFYSGPDIATSNDLENRLSKIERQINRLDDRLKRLENYSNTTTDINYQSNNMYMI